MKYQNKTFSSGANSKEYRENWDKIFGDKDKEEEDKDKEEDKEEEENEQD